MGRPRKHDWFVSMKTGFFQHTLDLRELHDHKIHASIAQQAAGVEENAAMWLIVDHDPVELHEYLNELGFSVTTFVPNAGEFWVFMGRIS